MKNAISHSSILGGSVSPIRRAATTLVGQLPRPGALILLACLCLSARAQTGEWAWMGGPSSIYGNFGVYGTQGTPNAENHPGGRESAASWTDSSGNFWLFGGEGFDADGQNGWLNDLWEFNPTTNEWAWMGGSKMTQAHGVYGALGTPSAASIPGSRDSATSCTDNSGNFWLFGGEGYDADGQHGWLNDLWEFNPSTKEWAWMSGPSSIYGNFGVYGTRGTPAAANVPGNRMGASCWTDSSGNFWLFGGYGVDSYGGNGEFNDLWEFNPVTKEWTWIAGNDGFSCYKVNGPVWYCGVPATVTTPGKPSLANNPGSRMFASGWTDSSGNFWLFGGWGLDANAQRGYPNDLWEFNPSLKEWAWMGGSSVMTCDSQGDCNSSGVYGTLGTRAARNNPGGREDSATWTDASGNLWLFGGNNFDANDSYNGDLNDLWEFDPSSNEWAWVGGSNKTLQPGVYGELGTPSAANVPGSRGGALSWTDGSGNLWLFGGYGLDGDDQTETGWLNDLWEYQLPSAAAPTFSVAAGTFATTQTVSISDKTRNAAIYYTLDGSTPTRKSIKYKTALSIAETTTVKAIAEAAGYANSSVASATYTIVKKQTIDFNQPTSPVAYGVKPIALSAKASSGLAVTFSVVSGPAAVSGDKLTITGAGTVVVAANQAGNANYTAAPQVTRAITVNKAKLTVTAKNLSMKQGAAVPTFTYTMTGFVNGDKQAKATTGAPRLTTTATSKSAAGSYPITVTAGTLAATNYSFIFVSGKLTVTN